MGSSSRLQVSLGRAISTRPMAQVCPFEAIGYLTHGMWADAITDALERSRSLDRLGKLLGRATATVVRPGRLKDLLSGTWLAHPLHPVLTDVTIGAWTSVLLLDVFGGEDSRGGADRLVLLGALSAVPTAVTGLSDLADVVNPEERSVGAVHALGNVTALLFYSAAYAARRRGNRRRGLLLSTAGMGIATGSGFLGGHLAYRLGIGVDQTQCEARPSEWTAVLDEAELVDGKPKPVAVGTTNLMLYRTGGRILCIANRCSHRGGPLHKGRVDGTVVRCPWHLSQFDLEDGSVVRGPATAPQPAYDTRVVDGKIEVRARTP
jgi:nitrite reductase/ring-hydroxylating ferredoxin subunit/uncharacterized membrane protein